ncbi:hypothetical protein [Geomicrobium sediminis]|uniref:Uncharacterized protein n=1 Tax=Geomicrobium sediminis TaxID=1347788 RepID=A0ABS2PAB4_9BACL|nr:hypothetical protein [Geomicrobium sediminis]MBM7632252.1 hypothetical protein [Geomicrobium sediminis]
MIDGIVVYYLNDKTPAFLRLASLPKRQAYGSFYFWQFYGFKQG